MHWSPISGGAGTTHSLLPTKLTGVTSMIAMRLRHDLAEAGLDESAAGRGVRAERDGRDDEEAEPLKRPWPRWPRNVQRRFQT
jgi:hypothetical protein